MLKNLLHTFTVFLTISSIAWAQDTIPRHLFSLAIGPSFATGKNPSSTIRQTSTGTQTQQYYEEGFGKGFSLAIGYSLMFSKHLGLDLNISRLFGSPQTTNHVYYNTVEAYQVESQNNIHAGLWKFNLSLLGRIPYKYLTPYFKGGLVFSTGNTLTKNVTEKVIHTNTGQREKGEFEVKNTGGFGTGINASMGLDILVSKNLFLFTEVNLSTLDYKPKNWELTKLNLNGKDQLKNVPLKEKKGTYTNKPSSANPNLTWKPSLSSLSLLVGLKIGL